MYSHRRSSLIQFGVLDKCFSHTLLEGFQGIYYDTIARNCLKELLETVYALFLKPHAHPFGHGLRT